MVVMVMMSLRQRTERITAYMVTPVMTSLMAKVNCTVAMVMIHYSAWVNFMVKAAMIPCLAMVSSMAVTVMITWPAAMHSMVATAMIACIYMTYIFRVKDLKILVCFMAMAVTAMMICM